MKKNTFRAALAIFIFSAITLLTSCLKDYDLKKVAGVEWNPTLAVPLVYTSLSINDILGVDFKNSTIHIGSDYFITLIYKGRLFSLRADEFLFFDNQSNSVSQTLSSSEISALQSAGSVTVPFSQNISFVTTGNTRVDTMFFKSGSLDLNISSNFSHGGNVAISIPSLSKNGTPYAQTLPLIFSGSTPVTATVNLDLNGYKMDMTTSAPNFNTIPVDFSLTLNYSGSSVNSGDNITITESLSNLKFQKLFGYIDQQILSPNADTVEVGIFKNALGGGTLNLVDSKISLFIANSFGVPISATFENFQGYNSNTNPTTTDIPFTGNIPINTPLISQIGQSATSTYIVNQTSTNSMMNLRPPYVIYKLNSQSNPAGLPTPPNTNFVLDTSNFIVDMEIEMPLYGTASGFVVQDTVASFVLETDDLLESFLLRTRITNGFPCEVKVQVYFVDSMYNKLDSLMNSPKPDPQIILPAAPVGANGKVITPVEKTTDVFLDIERAKKLNQMKHILVKAEGSTFNNGQQNVRIYSDYRIGLEMGAKAKLKVKL